MPPLPPKFEDLWGKIDTTDTVPTYVPKKIQEQVILYISGATLRLYVYDFTNNTWRYATLT